MRFILSMALVASATALVCHGYFNRDEAYAALSAADSLPKYDEVIKNHPYSLAAVEAGQKRLDVLVDRDPEPTGEDFFTLAWARILKGVDQERAPWVLPRTAGAIALAALLLAVLLPGTRFRMMTLLLALAGAAGLMPSYMEDGRQVDLVEGFSFTREAIAWNPFIAASLMVLAAFALGSRRRRDD